jgi:hypothetical protein
VCVCVCVCVCVFSVVLRALRPQSGKQTTLGSRRLLTFVYIIIDNQFEEVEVGLCCCCGREG